jgi:hypothetical protein
MLTKLNHSVLSKWPLELLTLELSGSSIREAIGLSA